MLAVLFVIWIGAVFGDAVGSGIIASRLLRLRVKQDDGHLVPVRKAQLLALLFAGWTMYGIAVMVSLFYSYPRYLEPDVGIQIRQIAWIVKASLLIPYFADTHADEGHR